MSTSSARRLLATVAAAGLPGSTHEWPVEPLSDVQWSTLIALAPVHRITGHLAAVVDSGRLPTTRSQRDDAIEAHATAMTVSLRLELALLDHAQLLDEAGVGFRVLKGSAAAHLDYPDPGLRSFGDVDLMVRSEDFDRTVSLLARYGHHRRYPQPRPGFDRKFSKGTSLLTEAGWEIDLHRTWVMGPFGLRLQLDDVWSGQQCFYLGDRELPALTAEMRFLHACFHATLGNLRPRLVPLRDIAQLSLGGQLDTTEVVATATRWGAGVIVSQAVSHAWDVLGLADVTALSAWAQRYSPDPREVRELALYQRRAGSYASKSWAALRAVPGLRDKTQYLTALAFPTRSYLEGRHDGFGARLRTGLRAIRDGRVDA